MEHVVADIGIRDGANVNVWSQNGTGYGGDNPFWGVDILAAQLCAIGHAVILAHQTPVSAIEAYAVTCYFLWLMRNSMQASCTDDLQLAQTIKTATVVLCHIDAYKAAGSVYLNGFYRLIAL